jgi:hypothetical protein
MTVRPGASASAHTAGAAKLSGGLFSMVSEVVG